MVDYNSLSDEQLLTEINKLADVFVPTGEPLKPSDYDSVDISIDDLDSKINRQAEHIVFEEQIPSSRSLYNVSDNGEIRINGNMSTEEKACAYKPNFDLQMISNPQNFKFVHKFKKSLSESRFGMSYMNKKSWDILLDDIIEKFVEASRIERFAVKDNSVLIFNKFSVDACKFEDPVLGITVYDLIEFHTLFKKLPMLKLVALDSEATKQLVRTYGDNISGIQMMFKEARMLNELRINTNDGWKSIKREDLYKQSSTEVESMNEQLMKSRAAAEIEMACDIKKPKDSFMTEKGASYRIYKNAKEMRQHSFGVAKQSFMSDRPKLIKTAMYSLIGLNIAIIGGISGAFNIGKRLVSK